MKKMSLINESVADSYGTVKHIDPIPAKGKFDDVDVEEDFEDEDFDDDDDDDDEIVIAKVNNDDDFEDDDIDEPTEPEIISPMDISDDDESTMLDSNEEYLKFIERDLLKPEIDRHQYEFRVKGNQDLLTGTPMAKTASGKYIFTVNGIYKSFNIGDLIFGDE